MKRIIRSKHLILFLLSLLLSLSLSACGINNNISNKSVAAEGAAPTQKEHSECALSLKKLLDEDPELMTLMEKSIKKAHEINGDKNYNPVSSIEDLYDFMDWATTCLPWNVLTDTNQPALYDHIDQGVDYIWFLFDQPLEELEGKGYYYPTLQYHEPISEWLREYSDEWGAFLSTPESWNDEYYEKINLYYSPNESVSA